jgi:hypothetical protein
MTLPLKTKRAGEQPARLRFTSFSFSANSRRTLSATAPLDAQCNDTAAKAISSTMAAMKAY